MIDHFSDYRGSKILVTGHTGFKGSWLSRLLVLAGAEVHGLALPSEKNSIYARSRDLGLRSSTHLDIRNVMEVEDFFTRNKFDGVFHLAAQPLVLKSYDNPLETFQTNVMGTANILDSVIEFNSANWVIIVTSDKVYKNIENQKGYTEDDPLGGSDPYSASKSATEMVVNSWKAVAQIKSSKVVLCSVRSGNVIGGGDIAENRLLPDLLRSFYANVPLVIRNPYSLRPWQHVLDTLNGYLLVGKNLINNIKLASEYNFGPSSFSKLTVEEIVITACELLEGSPGYVIKSDAGQQRESSLLWLSSERAIRDLGWAGKLNVHDAIKWTFEWELLAKKSDTISALDFQIHRFFSEKL